MSTTVNQSAEKSSPGWFRAMRGPEPLELIAANPHAFILAYMIGHRGQYSTTFNRYNLQPGEALLGDFEKMGMTRQQYRTAMRQLTDWKFATFKTTMRGCIGKLTDTRLFSIFRIESNHPKNQQPTTGEPSGNQRPANSQPLPRTGRPLKSFEDHSRSKDGFSKTESIDPSK